MLFRSNKLYLCSSEVPQLSSHTQTYVADKAASTGVDDRHGGAATTISGLEEGQGKDSFNQGRKIAKIDEDPDISLVQQMIHHDAQTQGRQEYDLEPNFEFIAPEEVYTIEPDISTANVPVSTAGAEVSTAAKSLVYIRRKRLGFEEPQRLQEQFDEEERQRIASVHKEASTFKPEEWDNMQAKIKADEELTHRYVYDKEMNEVNEIIN
ncbi:hypothetical protein Tco_1107859 [Tanacetum coccineum]